jgi:hypothetical protein
MDQRSICVFLAIKGVSAQAIHSELVAMLGSDAIASSTATKYPRQWQFPAIPCQPSEESPTTIIDDAILDALNKQPFSSIQELAKFICILTTPIHRHLTRSLGFVVKHLHWVPHSLTETQKGQHVTISIELLHELRSVKHQGWQFVVNPDES